MSSLIDLYLPVGVSFNILLYIILLVMGWHIWTHPASYGRKKYRLYLLLIIIACVFSYTGDYYHYYDIFERVKKIGGLQTHLEEIYQYSFTLSNGEYYIWRLIIWGTSIFMITATARILKLNPVLLWFVFLSYGIIFFVNGRVSLAMSMMFFGTVLMVSENSNPIIRFIGIILIASSFYFHKSALFGIGVILLSLICYKINKYTIGLCLLIFPLLIVLFQSILGDLLSLQNYGDNLALSSGQNYMNREEADKGLGRSIQTYLLWIDFVLWFCLIFRTVKNKVYQKWHFSKRIFVNFSFFTLLISSLFFFDLGASTRLLQLRFAEFAYLPSAVLIASCKQIRFSNKLTKWIIFISIAQTSYNYIYQLYMAILNPESLK